MDSAVDSVMRGGAWYNYRGSVRCANRVHNYPAFRDFDFGFRCVQTPSLQETPPLAVLRGGSWPLQPLYCRVSSRYRNFPDLRLEIFGFRSVVTDFTWERTARRE